MTDFYYNILTQHNGIDHIKTMDSTEANTLGFSNAEKSPGGSWDNNPYQYRLGAARTYQRPIHTLLLVRNIT